MKGKRSLAEDLDVTRGNSPGAWYAGPKHVVIVMDALREFSTKPLEWALKHVVEPGYTLTIVGVMPWLNLALSCKTWLDIWTLNLGDLSTLKERSEWTYDQKHKRLHNIVELCEAHGVVPLMKVAMGSPVRLVVLEQTTNLHATWIVFDRYHRRRRSFYMRRIPCNMVMMNADGQMDMLRVRPMLESGEAVSPRRSPRWAIPVPQLIISKEWMELLKKESKEEEQEKEGKNLDSQTGNDRSMHYFIHNWIR